jgi:hypothetical protein
MLNDEMSSTKPLDIDRLAITTRDDGHDVGHAMVHVLVENLVAYELGQLSIFIPFLVPVVLKHFVHSVCFCVSLPQICVHSYTR